MNYLIVIPSFVAAISLESIATVGLMEPWLLPQPAHAWILGCHLLASLLFVPAFQPALSTELRQARIVSSLLILGFSIVLPIIGPAIALASARLVLGTGKKRGPQSEYYFGEEQYLTNATPSGMAGRTSRSISELLHNPDVAMRRQAVLAAGNLEPGTAIPILRQAQQDSDEQVRIFARNFLGRIVETLESFLKLAHRDASDPGQQLDRFMHVLDRYQEYIDLGLLSERSRKSYVARCLELLAAVRMRQPEDEKSLCIALKLHLLDGQMEQAKACLDRLKQASPNPDITLPWELQINYQNRNWRALQELLSYLEHHCFNDPQFRKIYDFWRAQPRPAARNLTAPRPSA